MNHSGKNDMGGVFRSTRSSDDMFILSSRENNSFFHPNPTPSQMRTWVSQPFFVQEGSKMRICLQMVPQKLGDIDFRLWGPQKHSDNPMWPVARFSSTPSESERKAENIQNSSRPGKPSWGGDVTLIHWSSMHLFLCTVPNTAAKMGSSAPGRKTADPMAKQPSPIDLEGIKTVGNMLDQSLMGHPTSQFSKTQ
ncbi:hypothetical protein B0H14DRAFT_2606986 [Mycena olivaceomarginata]|nr:hypothetical protein B0H14DRAFT_2606986 [Mycena olivaceomarginata]